MFIRPTTDPFVNSFCFFSHYLTDMGDILYFMLDEEEDPVDRAEMLKDSESMCDDELHSILNELYDTFVTPFDREDIIDITICLDDISDYIEDTASKIVTCGVTKHREESERMFKLINEAVHEIEELVNCLDDKKQIDYAHEEIKKINNIENEGDRLYRSALSKLFHDEKDAIEIIRWHIIYESLENTLDACERLAETIEGVLAKNA